MRHARATMPLACRLLGHFWYATCIGTWGNDDRWTCKRCGRDGGELTYTKPLGVKSPR